MTAGLQGSGDGIIIVELSSSYSTCSLNCLVFITPETMTEICVLILITKTARDSDISDALLMRCSVITRKLERQSRIDDG